MLFLDYDRFCKSIMTVPRKQKTSKKAHKIELENKGLM